MDLNMENVGFFQIIYIILSTWNLTITLEKTRVKNESLFASTDMKEQTISFK